MFGLGKKKQVESQVESSVALSKIHAGEYRLVIKGSLTNESMKIMQATGAHEIDSSGDVVVLVDARQFTDFACEAAAEDMTFFSKYDAHINRIAVLADPKWKEGFMLLLGAGYRHAKVSFFGPDEEDAARQWLEA